MKFKNLTILLGFSLLVVFSCKKETNSKSINNSNTISTSNAPWGISNQLILDFPTTGSSCFCGPPAINCYDEVVVTTSSLESELYNLFTESLDNNTLGDFLSNQDYD